MEEDRHLTIDIRAAESPEDLDAVRGLFQEYWASFGFTPCFQGFETEVTTLPGKYAPPGGRLLLAKIDGAPAGCAALRPFDDTRGEMKRMYVRPAFRGRKLGEALVGALAKEARAIGYAELIADTIPNVMTTALAMYERLGFERIAPYSNETPDALHIRMRLRT
ncbi:MAG TPA: GNAT family N-acetyltransferase [Bryobacteraceae bacterium]|nr:GNAT family N-acetyltransferase [Bryobacteraceae bacterium]